MPRRSYAEMLSRPSVLQKPLLYKPPSSAARPASSPRRRLSPPPRNSHLPTSATVDIPRRLLPYYLSKAEYNTRVEENEADSVTSPTASDDDNARREWRQSADDGQCAVEDEQQWSMTRPSQSLRSPPFQSRRSYTGTSAIPSPPSLHHRPASAATSSSLGTINRVTTMPRRERSNSLGERPTLPELSTPHPPALTATSSKTTAQRLHPDASLSCGSNVTAYTEEQRRVFEAQVMQQVEALLQAQRSESHAELEACRVMAAEAQATLQTVEAALGEQIAGVQRSSSGIVEGTAARVNGRHTDGMSKGDIPHAAKVLSQSQFYVSVDTLAPDMFRIAAAAAAPAAEQLLEAIMSIQDGQDVPAVLRRVMAQFYQDLVRALVPPVMEFVNQQSQLLHQQGTAVAAATVTSRALAAREAGDLAPQPSDELLRAQAEVAALQEEVDALRRTLCSESLHVVNHNASVPTRDVPRSMFTTIASNLPLGSPQEDVISALQNRLFSECHAMLTRSRHEALLLRRSLEEERRQHFLTRLWLLKPSYPLSSHRVNAGASLAAAAAGAGDAGLHHLHTSTRRDLGTSPDLGASPRSGSGSRSSPVIHSSLSTRSPASSAPDTGDPPQQQSREAAALCGGSLPSAVHHAAPHRWTPARSPLHLAFSSEGAREHDEDQAAENRFPVEQSPASSALPVKPPPSYQALSTTRSRAAPCPAASLQSAMRVAEEVLRTTAPATYSATEPAHPYYREERDGGAAERPQGRSSGGATSVSSKNGDAPLAVQRRGEGFQPPPRMRGESVSLLDPSDSFNEEVYDRDPPPFAENLTTGSSSRASPYRSAFISVQGRHSSHTTGTSMNPISGSVLATPWNGSTASAEHASAPPSDPHERRVWDKTVELLGRYSIV
ncbi:hypothetical protein JKF63_02639 [Porcisia hertigi]|uniref:Uncharacterized protein n=1 Tax=Porcisia hertigi TaxID=2761500 RepID=A0A836I1B4_9TRYP|nr:hypothetical protein JKF63_02639 [Porcisia hertigi]